MIGLQNCLWHFHCSEDIFAPLLAAAKDSTLGTATVQWERFEFNKDAPLDEDNDDVEGY